MTATETVTATERQKERQTEREKKERRKRSIFELSSFGHILFQTYHILFLTCIDSWSSCRINQLNCERFVIKGNTNFHLKKTRKKTFKANFYPKLLSDMQGLTHLRILIFHFLLYLSFFRY